MGLSTTHGAWSAPYSAFNRFRHRLAKEIGINLKDYAGYDDEGTKDLASIDHPLMPLFNHSDCDGILTPQECGSIATGLNEVLLKLPVPTSPNLDSFTEDGQFAHDVIKFRDGCLEAYSKKENMEFH